MIPEKDLKRYQSIPFWSWNDKLEPEELRRQIRSMKDAGIGGFFMHARGGLLTEYMGEEWMDAVAACIDEAEKLDMDAWCYDENGWPSGFAGMKLLENPANYAHYLTCEERAFDPAALACYRVTDGRIARVYKDDGAPCHCVYDRVNASVVDILNPDIVKKFIEETHEKYYARFGDDFGKHMAGFFTDEPQYFRWDTAYSPMILTAYRGRYGEDILDDLGALFLDCDASKRLRFRYWRLMNELYTENFAGQIFKWCEAHNCMLTGHGIEERSLFWQMICCAGIMPFYEYQHIPGIDWLGREIDTEVAPRQAFSAAQQLGKKQVLTETFACAGWDVTPKELKRIAEWQYVNGVNLMCQHLYPYSIRGQRKRDYPAFYSEHNPWTTELRHFNDYFTNLGYMLAESREAAAVAVIHPIHSAYFDYKRHNPETLAPLEEKCASLVERLGAAGIGHHYVDEYLLEKHGSVEGDRLIMGNCAYDYVVIPDMDGLDASTVELLDEFLLGGGKMWLQGGCPGYVDGEPAELGYQSNIAFEDMIDADCAISNDATEIRATLRRWEKGDFLYAVNLSKTEAYAVEYRLRADGLSRLDLETGERQSLYYTRDGEHAVLPLKLAAGESAVILLDGAPALPAPEIAPSMRALPIELTIARADKNTLTLDTAQLSYDGEAYTEPLPVMAISDRLLRERTNRKLYLKYAFTIKEMPASLYLEAEKMGARCVWINSAEVALDQPGEIDRSNGVADALPHARIGENEIVFEIDYAQSEHVYRVFNGVYYERDGGTESLINCLSYETDIEDIYLRGDFGVEAALEPGEKNTRISKDGAFAITSSKRRVRADQLLESGYPFFSGEMTFAFEIDATGDETRLTIGGRYAVARVEINGKSAVAMFSDTADIAGMLVPGKNEVRVTIISARRNTLGPFHFARDPEPYGVSPDTFSLYGSWVDGKSERYADRYAFVYFGIDSLEIG
ncbi:MAG: glycosyl hydrolase [Christensenellales bacterium]|jgi:hypothetical protein